MSFLNAVPSLKRMCMVNVCGMLFQNEIRDPLESIVSWVDNTNNVYIDVLKAIVMESNIIAKTLSLGLTDELANEFPPIVSLVVSSLHRYVNTFASLSHMSKTWAVDDRQAFRELLLDVTLTNRGDVDVFETTRRQLGSGSLSRFYRDERKVFRLVKMVGHPAEVKAQLENREQVYGNEATLWRDYVGGLSSWNFFELTYTFLFQQNVDFIFTMLPSHLKLEYFNLFLAIHLSPSAWAHFILELPFDQREELYRDYGHLILMDVASSRKHPDLFETAVRELVTSLTLGQFKSVARKLAKGIKYRPYDRTLVEKFKFFWSSSPESLRTGFTKEEKYWSDLSKTLKRLSCEVLALNRGPSSFSLVIQEAGYAEFRAFAFSDDGIELWKYLMERERYGCLKLLSKRVPITEIASTLDNHISEVELNKLYRLLRNDTYY